MPMYEGRQRAAWEHTSHILATMQNVNRGKRQTPVRADQCNPFGRQRPSGTRITAGNIGILRKYVR